MGVEGVQEHFAGDWLKFAVEFRETGGAKEHNKFITPGTTLTLGQDLEDETRDTKNGMRTMSRVFPIEDEYFFILKVEPTKVR